MTQACELPPRQRGRDPGPMYWAWATAAACAAAAPFPFFWAPPLWIPRLTMPIGMGLMSLQYVAEILALATGRTAPFAAPETTL